MSILSTYPRYTQNRMADLKTGIPAKCKFLPSVADIVAMAESYETFRPAPTSYKRLNKDDYPQGYDHDVESRRAFVAGLRRQA